jgi:hypothetical protein
MLRNTGGLDVLTYSINLTGNDASLIFFEDLFFETRPSSSQLILKA